MTHFSQLLPADEFNRKLEADVHPPDWKNPTPSGRYNLVVIGAGTAGLVTAAGAAGLGAKVALIERSLMGGDCLNVGCVPSKAVISAARAAAAVRNAREFGVNVPGDVNVDFGVAMQRMRRLRARISPHDSARRFRDLGVDVFFGDARFVSSNTIEVDGTKLNFKRAVIATGARASAPPIPGLDSVDYLTNETLFSLTMQTSNPMIYAAGDVCSPWQFTHAADFSARIVIQNALFKGRKKSSSLIIPWSTYTTPEIAHVGLYEKQAEAIRRLGDQYSRTRLTPFVKSLFQKWLAWTR